ncbi:MAG: mechanosensitive ion channel family protein [Candidatus Micrarchaeota archaeon]
MDFGQYLNWEFLGNTGTQYATALAAFIAINVAIWVFKTIILSGMKRIAKKTSFKYDDFIVDFISEIKAPFYLIVSLFFSARFLTLSDWIFKALEYALAFAVMYYLIKGILRIVTHMKNILADKQRKVDGEHDTSMLDVMEKFVQVIIWAVGILVVLDNLGIDVTALIAGLGIGGLAIAIASQAILADILAALSIYFDKPFRTGDFIIVGNDMGTVKKIGLKTTRIETLQGQELIMSNQELTNSRVNNYKRMKKRRIVFPFGVVYGTPVSKLRKIPQAVKKIIDSVKDCKADRVHFKAFGNFSLDYEAVYYLDSPDYNRYMDSQQEINLKIAEAFEKDGIEFAFPTQTVYVKK